MKLGFFAVLILLGIGILAGCGDDKESKSAKDAARESLGLQKETPSTPASSVDLNNQQPPAQSVNTSVPHYICPDNCEGSGGPAQGPCPVCGKDYIHNTAYHNNTASTTPPTNISTEGGTTVTPPPPTPSSAQNAAGVWHYTCPSGCEGGSGTAGTCANCGGTLAHNTEYHN